MVSFNAGQNMNINVQGNQIINEGSLPNSIPLDIKEMVVQILKENPELLKKDEKTFIQAMKEKLPKIATDLIPIIAKAVLL